MKYDQSTGIITIDGVEMTEEFVEELVAEFAGGQLVKVTPDHDENGKLYEPFQYWVVRRAGTGEDGQALFTKVLTEPEDVLPRIRRSFKRWGRRNKPGIALPGCTYPACACRPDIVGKRAVCKPSAGDEERPNAHIIVPRCLACGNELMVGKPNSGASDADAPMPFLAANYPAHCTHSDCGWEGTVGVLVKTTRMKVPEPDVFVDDANRPPDSDAEGEE